MLGWDALVGSAEMVSIDMQCGMASPTLQNKDGEAEAGVDRAELTCWQIDLQGVKQNLTRMWVQMWVKAWAKVWAKV